MIRAIVYLFLMKSARDMFQDGVAMRSCSHKARGSNAQTEDESGSSTSQVRLILLFYLRFTNGRLLNLFSIMYLDVWMRMFFFYGLPNEMYDTKVWKRDKNIFTKYNCQTGKMVIVVLNCLVNQVFWDICKVRRLQARPRETEATQTVARDPRYGSKLADWNSASSGRSWTRGETRETGAAQKRPGNVSGI